MEEDDEEDEACDGRWRVQWRPGVRVRAAPSERAEILRIARTGDVLRSTRWRGGGADGCGWIELAEASGGGWVRAATPALGRLLTPLDDRGGGPWGKGRRSSRLRRTEAALAAARRHDVLALLARAHFLSGLPVVATEDAVALVGAAARMAAAAEGWRSG